MTELYEKPLAVKGLVSYRYRGRYGWIMISARDTQEALREAARSSSHPVHQSNLEVWTEGVGYIPTLPEEQPMSNSLPDHARN